MLDSPLSAEPSMRSSTHASREGSASLEGVNHPEAILALLRALQLQQRPSNLAAPILPSPFHLESAGPASLPGHEVPRPPVPQDMQQQQQRKEELQQQIRRTIYINDLDQSLSEQQLATFFSHCGPVADVRISGDSNNAVRFGFVEFADQASVLRSLALNGKKLGRHTAWVSPSKTAIIPVKNEYLPRSQEEQAAVARTVYVSNIHFIITSDILHFFFSSLCGPVARLRLLRYSRQNTKIAFVEFCNLEGASQALECTGKMLGPLKLRVSPSKTPVKSGET